MGVCVQFDLTEKRFWLPLYPIPEEDAKLLFPCPLSRYRISVRDNNEILGSPINGGKIIYGND